MARRTEHFQVLGRAASPCSKVTYAGQKDSLQEAWAPDEQAFGPDFDGACLHLAR